MIIDYKPELIHEYTAIECVSEFLSDACTALIRTTEDINDFDLPIGSILSCLSNSHKLDYIRLVKNAHSKQKQIIQAYRGTFHNKHKTAIAMYQSASEKNMIDGLKPHQFINRYLSNPGTLTSHQAAKSKILVSNIDDSFSLASSKLNLQVGQRLYRGVSMNEAGLNEYIDAYENQRTLKIDGYMSTSLSESIAKSFAALSYLGKLRADISSADDLTDFVIVLTNRREGLPFIVPDALRKPAYNQGQMEVLLSRGLELKPTHFELTEFNAKIYADIV
ncbi:ADP-ribosyltransferase [Rheinheimera soli]|uniref:ADP-ribosyltransferase n=1 Tax=Rheinheimera soli TaxID=443616 RepID=UPI001E3ADDAA|nr:ADP-ribosyltransferase [Rheinheimera soli]